MNNVDLISRSALLKIIKARHKRLENPNDAISIIVQNELSSVMDEINDAPTIDAVPVVHGQWVKAHGMMPPEYHHRKQCSMCGAWALQDYFGRERMSHYCPNCGAKMDLEESINE